MARELRFVITAETYEAEAKLRVLEAQITQLNKDVEKGAITWEDYEKQLKGASAAAAAQRQTLEETRKSVDGTTKAVSPLTAMIMRYASGAVIGAAVKSTAAWASNLQDLSAKSSISVTQLQKLEVIAGRSGGSLEQIATAASMLLDKLGSNDKALIQAVSTLGLNLYTLRSQDPGQTFIDLATAIAKVEDPAKRMALAVDVFGRQGRQLMPTIMEIGKGIGDIGTSSEETIKQLDALDDVMADLKKSGRGLLADLFGPWASELKWLGGWVVWLTTQFREMLTVLREMEQFGIFGAQQRYAERQLKPPEVSGARKSALPIPLITGELGDPTSAEYRQVVKDLTAQHKDAAKAAKELARAHRKLGLDEQGRIIARDLGGASYAPTVGGWWGTGASPGLMGTGEMPSWLRGDLPSRPITTGLWKGPSATQTRPALKGFDWEGTFGPSGIGGAFTTSLLAAYQGGGNVGASIGVGLSQYFQQALGTGGKYEAFGKTTGGKIAGGIAAGVGAAMLAYSIGQSKGKGAGALAGAASGAMSGAAYGPWGMAVGAGIGAIAGALGGRDSVRVAKMREEARAQYDELQAMAKYGGTERWFKTLWSTKDPDTFQDALKRINGQFNQMKKTVSEVSTALQTLTERGGLMSDDLFKKIKKHAFNEDIQKAVFQFMQAQAQTALKAIESYVTEAQIRTTGGAQALAASAVAVFEELVRQGMTAVEALQALTPTLDALGAKFDALGLGGGEAFDTLRRLASIAGDEVRGPLVKSIDDLTRLMTALGNLGLITQEIFSGLSQEIAASYQQLVDLGTDSHDALLLLQAPLQRLYELQQRFGFQTDDATQALLDQAKAAGLVGSQFMSAEERMVEAITKLIQRIDTLLGKIYGIGPAAEAAAQGITNAFGSIHLNDDGSGYWTGKPIDPDAEMPEFASGSSGLRDFGRETVARLHGKEAVVTEAQWRALTAGQGVTVTVDARGALLGDPASQAALARMVSDAVMAQQTLRGAVN